MVHGLRGKASNRRFAEKTEREEIKILSAPVDAGFGPTLAAEYPAKVREVHVWRPPRSRCGELVQWDTSDHAWLEGRGERLYLIAMIDDAKSRLFARFVRHDSSEENMKLLGSYLEKFGRPVSFYTDKASHFQTAEKHKRNEPGVEKDPVEMPPTQIGRAFRELGITWIASAQAKGRVERNFGTAQDRLVKGMRVVGVQTLEQANRYLNEDYLVWWERELTVDAANPDDAHRPLEKSHHLAASLSHVETRQVRPDYTVRWNGKLYQIERAAVTTGLRGGQRAERRLDGMLAVRHGDRYLRVAECVAAEKKAPPAKPKPARRAQRQGSNWNKNFDLKKGPKVWQATQESGYRRESTIG